MTDARPALSVVVATRDRPQMLERALASLRLTLRNDDELLVVDSASRDEAAVCEVAERFGASVVRCSRAGETVARNAGWQAASHEVVAYVDDDVWVDAGWADAMARAFGAHRAAVFVTGRIDIPDGQGTLAVSIKDDDVPAEFDRASGGLIGHAANLGVRRSALAEVNGFDELLGAGGRFHAAPENDLFDRLLAAGHTGVYAPDARAWHDQWRRVRDYVRLQRRYGVGAGARLSKLWRSDRRRWRRVVVDDAWRWGVRSLGRELVRGDWYRALGTSLRLAGMVGGFAAGSLVPVRDGHFRPHRSSSS